MEKKKALGGDPLSWLKEKKREEKEEANTVDQERQTQKPITSQDKEEEERQDYLHTIREHRTFVLLYSYTLVRSRLLMYSL